MAPGATASAVAGLRDVDKAFGATHAVSAATVEFQPGAIHCIVGENGAGKSTIVKLLAGVHEPDRGVVWVGDETVTPGSPRQALEAGVSTVFQELTLVRDLTVAENVFLAREPRRAWAPLLDRRRRVEATVESFRRFGIEHVDANAAVRSLGIARQQLVEIVKAVSIEDQRLLILDEPTSALTIVETEVLFRLLRRLRADGVAIVYVTHQLEDVDALGDTLTVMRDGAVVSTRPVGAATHEEIIAEMVGRRLDRLYPPPSARPGGELLAEIAAPGPGGETRTIAIPRGAVVGVFGLVGSGRTELVRALLGADPPRRGSPAALSLGGVTRRLRSPRRALAAGVAMVPEDRKAQGIVPQMSVAANVALSSLDDIRVGGCISNGRIRAAADPAIAELGIKAASSDDPIVRLSGGNQQKCLLARALLADVDLIVLDEPTRGIDIASRAELYRIVRRACDGGRAVLMVTSDLPEALGMSDVLHVMRAGELVGTVAPADTCQEEVMALALGRVVGGAEQEATGQSSECAASGVPED